MSRVSFRSLAPLAVAGLALAGCTADGSTTSGTAGLPAAGAIAFEAIDGAPSTVNERLVGRLTGEAASRRIQVVARDGAPRYRVRGYMATSGSGASATVTYVWDVFDPQQRRSTRIAGEERVAAQGRDAWTGLDDAAAGRIAARSMDQIAAWMATPQSAAPAIASAPPAAEPTAQAPVVTAASTFASPQAAPAGAPPATTAQTGGPLEPLPARQ
ncbi:hypothetical protein E8L99_00275 [Phreatobacter aquaticus]|uniref:DUF3576 domain-containing protein n=1 Tax=Phreatobacter aquaticus TaxID=2570229 RepID=A0A4D7Q817_9HYPH|nr:hypothetical protein [Phreatobacter aquaticus]QCK84340.1 hypothetical protein E8L99_00275 [Phreatobacter aquaticus]